MPLSYLDKISEQHANNLPFVVYRKPNEGEVKIIFQKDRELHYVNDFSETGFIFAPFDCDSPVVLLKMDEVFAETFEPGPKIPGKVSIVPDESASEKDFYLEKIKKAITKIQSGSIDKVVLSRCIDLETSKTPLVLFNDLLNKYPNAYCYIWFHPKIGLWLGATPEIFLETRNDQFRTMSLAGTQIYRVGEVAHWEEKELKEQRMVTQFIHDSLSDKVSGLEVSEPTSTRAGNLWHIKTSVSGKINNAGLEDIIKALHPTPAVCGVPKKLAKAFIVENENYERQFYTGFLGELNFKEDISRPSTRKNQENKAYRTIINKTSLFVNLRCMQIKGNIVKVYVGGGITNGSVPELEWQETRDKSSTMLNIVLK